ncbi:MAG: polyprenyl synthetase family protein [Clostridia bacterium]|nr:polyprenyl synthetase family protein [Clostridia bacterium]
MKDDRSDRYISLVEDALIEYLKDQRIPPTLREAMLYSVQAGGKRLRPCLTLATCEMVGGNVEDALPLACGIEMIHTYSLIHDDLPCIDNDDMRRGKPSNHKKFGEATAVLAGDGLLTYAFQIMLRAAKKTQNRNYINAISAIANGAGVWGVVAGQIEDKAHEKDPNAGEKELLDIHSRKTGALITSALIAGAYTGYPTQDELSAVLDFGEIYGVLFQITDDILDVEGDEKLLGKSIGKDGASGKLTYPKLYGMSESRRMAVEAAVKAKHALDIFGERAKYLYQIVDYTIGRKA